MRVLLASFAFCLAACSADDTPPTAREVTQLEVSIDATNNCSLENKPVACQQVAAAIKARYPTSKPRIFICVDKQTRAEAALEVLNSINAAGFPAADFQCGKAASG
jgi:biopolymer transport protein ExbD